MTPLVVGYIGRADVNKSGSPSPGYGHILYEAMQGTDWWVVLAGDGAPGPPPMLESSAKDRVRVYPHSVSNIGDWYRALDVFVLPSASEGFPLSVLEALTCGCRVAATRVSDLEAVFGSALAFFDHGDVDGLRNAVRCAPPPEAGQRIIAEEFTVERFVRQYEEALQ